MLVLFLKVILVAWALRAANAALSLRPRSRSPARAAAERRAPFVSIVVPARDEERAVEPATRSKCLQDDPAFEVVVVDDRSSDGTREILRRLETEFPGTLRVVDGVEPPPDWLGKPHALDEGARAAKATRAGATGSSSRTRTSSSRRISSRGRSRTPRETAWTS